VAAGPVSTATPAEPSRFSSTRGRSRPRGPCPRGDRTAHSVRTTIFLCFGLRRGVQQSRRPSGLAAGSGGSRYAGASGPAVPPGGSHTTRLKGAGRGPPASTALLASQPRPTRRAFETIRGVPVRASRGQVHHAVSANASDGPFGGFRSDGCGDSFNSEIPYRTVRSPSWHVVLPRASGPERGRSSFRENPGLDEQRRAAPVGLFS
jgi:hypothetical protein